MFFFEKNPNPQEYMLSDNLLSDNLLSEGKNNNLQPCLEFSFQPLYLSSLEGAEIQTCTQRHSPPLLKVSRLFAQISEV